LVILAFFAQNLHILQKLLQAKTLFLPISINLRLSLYEHPKKFKIEASYRKHRGWNGRWSCLCYYRGGEGTAFLKPFLARDSSHALYLRVVSSVNNSPSPEWSWKQKNPFLPFAKGKCKYLTLENGVIRRYRSVINSTTSCEKSNVPAVEL
jgi:hypothetical protein